MNRSSRNNTSSKTSKSEILKIIKAGEGLRVEFKLKFSEYEKIAKEIIAFANTSGGKIIFGVDDNCKIKGIESEKGIVELIEQTITNYCEPVVKYEIEIIEIENRLIAILHIRESKVKPHRIQDFLPKLDISNAQVYVRVNDKSVPIGKEMIKVIQSQVAGKELVNYKLEKNEKIVFDYLAINESITARKLSQIGNISSRRASRTLINLVRASLLIIHCDKNSEDYFTSIK